MNEKLWAVIAGLVVAFVLILSYNVIQNQNQRPCYATEAILNNQWVGSLEGCCDNCLIFNTTELVCTGKPSHGNWCQWQKQVLYFEHENQLRADLADGQAILLNWCWVDDDFYVKGVTAKK